MPLSPLRQERLARVANAAWPDVQPEVLPVLYHGVPLHLEFTNSYLQKSVRAQLPSDWCVDSLTPVLTIGLTSLTAEEDPEDEFQVEDDWVIQRDFIALTQGPRVRAYITTLEDSFFNLMRYLLPPHLHERGVLVLHSACVVDDADHAHVFLGDSGAGKTTLSQMSHPRRVLGDDVNLVRLGPGGIEASVAHLGQAYSSPVDLDRWFPVRGFYTLAQTPNCRLDPIPHLNKVKALSKAIFFSQSGRADSLLGTVSKVVSLTEFQRLSFAKDSPVWRQLDGQSS